jgi:phosphoribosylglycinamide formyltransferase-1
MIKLAIFASGNGSNFQAIAEYFAQHPSIQICHLFCNKPDAYVIKRAQNLGIEYTAFNKAAFYSSDYVLNQLRQTNTNWIVLAGFLWLIPHPIIEAYRDEIINIHPALLPAFGGKGMYGHKVHEAVIASGNTKSGITIHLVDEVYDNGKTLFQATCPVLPTDTAESLAERIHELEHAHFPAIIERTVLAFVSK